MIARIAQKSGRTPVDPAPLLPFSLSILDQFEETLPGS
jgi:hypothetical protein